MTYKIGLYHLVVYHPTQYGVSMIIKNRLGKEIVVDSVIQKAIISPDNTITGKLVESTIRSDFSGSFKLDKILNEDGIDIAIIETGERVAMINTVKHQKYNYVDLRK